MSKQKRMERMERLHAREVVLYKKKYRGEATEAELVELKELRCINNIHSFLTYSYGNEEVLLEKYFDPIQDWKGDCMIVRLRTLSMNWEKTVFVNSLKKR